MSPNSTYQKGYPLNCRKGIENDEVLRKYGARSLRNSVSSRTESTTRTTGSGRIAELTFRNDSSFCNVDDTDNCVHIGFAWALSKVYRVLASRGKRKPEVKEKQNR